MLVNTFELCRLLLWREYMIGGSYVVDREKANDIDVVFHELRHEDGAVEQSLLNGGFRALQAGDGKYDEIDHNRIIKIYEGTIKDVKYNIIVVGTAFWPAYMGAISRMRSSPELFGSREARVHLHRHLCKQVADIADIELEDGAA